VTGINSLDEKQSLQLYPNPFKNQTTLRTNKNVRDGTLTIINTFGQTVKQMANINGHTIILERDNLSRGLYSIYLSENNKIIAKTKFIITN
jgi:hypothetical protein